MNPDAMREALALLVDDRPADSMSFGATVTVICTDPESAARWMEATPNGLLPESRVPVQVVLVPMYAEVGA